MQGKRHGYGELTYDNGDMYEGHFANGGPYGHGIMHYSNGRNVTFYNGRKKGLLPTSIAAAGILIGALMSENAHAFHH